MTPVSIALVDDHRVVARSLQAYLESFSDLRVVGVAACGEELLDRLREWNPDIVLLDLLMPGGLDGIQTAERIRARAPSVRVIALTASLDEARMVGVLRAGAAGYVRKDSEPEVLLSAVRAVASGKSYIDPQAARAGLVTVDPADALTPRELDVLRQMVAGHSNKEIGDALRVTEETVKTHVGHVLAKLHADNRVQAIVQALRGGLVTLDEIE